MPQETPPEGELGRTLIGPPPSDEGGVETGQTSSEAPLARRFDEGGQETWFGHLPRDSHLPVEHSPVEEIPPKAAAVRARPAAAITRTSPARPGDEAWFHVRGPAKAKAKARPVRALAQRRPLPKLELWGVTVPPWVIGAAILAAGLGGAWAARMFPAPPELKVIGFEVSADGSDLLTVSCGACPDGSLLRLGSARATLVGGVGRLASSGLSVGENRLPMELELPGAQPKRIEVKVALAFRVSTDLRGITEVPPYALVVVTAPRGTSVSIGGTPMPSDPGIVRAKVDLSPDAQGAEARASELERKVPVRVVGPDLERATHATIAASVVPLVLDSRPTSSEGQWSITGRTSPGARVLIVQDGRTLVSAAVDAAGRFALRTAGAHPGAAVVAASAAGRVSRQVSCHLPAAAPPAKALPEPALPEPALPVRPSPARP